MKSSFLLFSLLVSFNVFSMDLLNKENKEQNKESHETSTFGADYGSRDCSIWGIIDSVNSEKNEKGEK